jgi:TolB-like protein/Tfp pilus assembly protein PilF
MSSLAAPTLFRFRECELDAAAFELRRHGKPVRLERRPMELLLLLVKNRGALVSRDEIVRHLWGERAFVDVEMGVNTAIRKVRQALNDPSTAPVFIETVPGKGYRFVASVDAMPAAAPPFPARTRIAVLPFENLGAGAEREYVADGLTEETIAALAQIDAEHIAVIGRTSVMAYKRTTKSLDEIGREMNVEYLLESSIRAEGERVRVTAKLIRARDQDPVWSASFDSEPGSILEFQRELAIAIAEQIRLRISPERLAMLTRRQTQDAEAYDLYLHGRDLWRQLSPLGTRQAIAYYTRATQRDPNYALAWSGIADAYAAAPINGDAPPLQMWRPARDAVARALAAESELTETQTTLAFVSFWLDWDWPAAEAAYLKAITLDANHAMAHRMLGVLYSHSGRHEAARSSMRRARELDMYGMHYALSAMIELHARDYDAALNFARQATVVAPDFWIGHYHLGQAYEQLGHHDLALEALTQAGRLVGGNSKVVGVRGYIFGKLGRTNDAQEVLSTLHAVSAERYFPPYATALVLMGLGHHEQALEWLERAYEARDVHLIFLPVDPKWDGLQKDARFRDLVKRCGFITPRSLPA